MLLPAGPLWLTLLLHRKIMGLHDFVKDDDSIICHNLPFVSPVVDAVGSRS